MNASVRWRILPALGATASLLLTLGATDDGASSGEAGERAAAPASRAGDVPFEPVHFERIPVPPEVRAGSPSFTPDGKHLLFPGTHTVDGKTRSDVWITDLKGKGIHCLTCSTGADTPRLPYVFPFADGKRVFLGFYGVLECAPSIVDCRTSKYLPYDLSTANPPLGVIPTGGAANRPQTVVRQGAYPTLAQDGKHIAYSDVRTDGIEQMVVAKLVRKEDKYVAEDPKVINPPGPTSATDRNVDAWSESTGLFELKTFTHGGRDITYVQAGGTRSDNPEVWEVNLKTGARKRLTNHPDWDEDYAGSPDGKSAMLWSNRTLHMWDALGGLLPHRGFIDAPMIAAEAGMLINTPNNIACGGVMWLMPGEGDHGGSVSGQPIVAPEIHAHDTVSGWGAWSPDGTMFAPTALKDGAGLFSGDAPDYLLAAKMSSRKPTKPEPVVSSDVGDWAPAPADWHPAFGYVGDVTLDGPGGGTVDISYNGKQGAVYGDFSATYKNYSEDGKTFLDGTKKIDVQPGITKVHEVTNLVMTGEHTGSLRKDLEISGGNTTGTPTYKGSSTATYDGKTVSGPPEWLNQKGSCPERLPKKPKMTATTKSLGHDRYEIKVVASVAGMGPHETTVDTRPVTHARIDTPGQDAYTDDRGIAVITAPSHRPATVRITAGETITSAKLRIG
ncbi:hypothetical protein [Streptomyces canus]|uniref:hypothetical protein n=1 Tax=Streptomyces canus TaxID=58343 RepID=UPI0037FA4E45